MRASIVRLWPVWLAVACGGPVFGPAAPTTKLTPGPGPFNDKVTVTLEADGEATVFVTTDGSDPTNELGSRKSGPSPFKVELTRTTTLTFFATNGSDEPVRSVQYVRAGGKKGTVSGVISVDTVGVGLPIALLYDGQVQEFPALEAAGEIPFAIDGLETGRHRLIAVADRNGDGNYVPVLDLSSDPYVADLDLGDAFKAGAENVRLFLGASDDGLCTITGTVKAPAAKQGEGVRMTALNPEAFTQAGQDPTGLLAQLQRGDQLVLDPSQDAYPYSITNLEPGRYVPVPALTSLSGGGFGLHFIANPLSPVRCEPGTTAKKNFTFGPAGVSGTVVADAPQRPGGGPAAGIVVGVVAAKRVSLSEGIDALLMPVVLLPDEQAPGKVKGTYSGSGLKAGADYQVRFFQGLGQQGLVAALAWVINPLASSDGATTLRVGAGDATLDLAP